MAFESVLANGKNYDFGNLTLMLFGTSVLLGFTKISYEVDQPSKNNYGAGRNPISYGLGNKIYKPGSITVYTEELRAIAASAPGGSILNIPPSTIKVMLSGDGTTFATDTLSNVRFTNDPFSSGQGDTQILVTLNFEWAGLDHVFG